MAKGWIDVHGHFGVPNAPSQRAAQRWDFAAETNLDFMDRTGIAVQLLSNYGPSTTDAIIASNTYGASLVAAHPDRFGLLPNLPLADPDRAVLEIHRGLDELDAHGFAIQTHYAGTYLGDPSLGPVWAELDRLRATVFIHPTPSGYEPLSLGRPGALFEVTFDTARSVIDMLFAGVCRSYPRFNAILAHAGGALPAIAERLATLGTLPWIPNPKRITATEMRDTFRRLYFDTALAGSEHSLAPVLAVTSPDHLVYGADFGAPCTDEGVIESHLASVRAYERLSLKQRDAIGRNALRLFPKLEKRVGAEVDFATA